MACTCVRGGDAAALSASGESTRGIVSESTLSLGPVSTQDAAALPRQEAEVGRRFSGLLRVFGSDKRFRWSKRAMRVWAECGADKSGSTKYELKKSWSKVWSNSKSQLIPSRLALQVYNTKRLVGFQRGSQMSWFQWTRFMEEVTLLGHVTLQHKKIGWFPTWLPTWFSNVVVSIQVVVLSEPLVKFPVAIE